jgi:hypothetical protein
VRRTHLWIALAVLGAAGSGSVVSRSTAADAAVPPPPDAQMLLDLDLLKSTDLSRERELYKRMPILENMRFLETMPSSEATTPRPTPAPTEVKER